MPYSHCCHAKHHFDIFLSNEPSNFALKTNNLKLILTFDKILYDSLTYHLKKPCILLKYPFNNINNLQLYLLTSNSSDKKYKNNNWIDSYKK